MEFSRQEYWSGLPTLLQRIFLTQGADLGLPHCTQILCHLSHHPWWLPSPIHFICLCVYALHCGLIFASSILISMVPILLLLFILPLNLNFLSIKEILSISRFCKDILLSYLLYAVWF